MIDYAVVDVETTGATNGTIGNPYTDSNRLCYIGCWNNSYDDWSIDVEGVPYGDQVENAREVLLRAIHRLLVGFAIKFDLAWLRRYRIVGQLPDLWDCQYAHFVITGQIARYPSLNQVAEHYGLGQKLDIVKTEYWDKGIDTDQIPPEIVKEYLKQDVILTQQVFEKQMKDLEDKPQLKRLIWYGCQDLAVTLEMEWNGIKYDMEKSMGLGDGIKSQIGIIDKGLLVFTRDLPINWNSDAHLSAILYGGFIEVDTRESYLFQYKDQRKAPVYKSRIVTTKHEFPRLVEPIKGSGLKKEGLFSTAEPILRKLKASGDAKKIIDLILTRTSLETKRNKYYHGFPEKYKQMEWTNNLLHTNLNHVVTQTGRLSSSKPNVQNLEDQMRECVVSRFPL